MNDNSDNTNINQNEKEKKTDKNTNINELNKINIVLIETELNEFYAKTNITQFYQNTLNSPIELILRFPYNSNVQFSKFNLELNDNKIISKVIDKEKAEEKYNDAIANKKVGAISSHDEQYINVIIGNINPGDFVKLTTEFIQFLDIEDMSFCYSTIKNFPKFCNKNNENILNLKKIEAKINIKCHSKITRLITKGFSQEAEKNFNDDYTQCQLNYYSMNSNTNAELKNDEFKILFRTDSMNNLNLITQYDPNKNETSCILNMVYNKSDIIIPTNEKPSTNDNEDYIKLYQQNIINNNPSLFIFCLDQSGSMSGESIKIAIKTLIFFLKSLPKNSFYHLIGFGSSFRYIHSEDPIEYTSENVNASIKEIEKLDADLGGTDLLKPLKEIFQSNKYDNINLCRNLFILTDGYVECKDICLDLIKKNSNLFRVHTFGLGNSFDRYFIEEAGKKGSYNFVQDISKLKMNVIQVLNKTLRSYLFNTKINVKNIEKEHEYIPKDKIYYQDEPINYYFIVKNKINNDENINIEFEYYDKNELIKKEYVFDKSKIFKEKDGDIISKIIIGNILNNNSLPKDEDIELSKKYQILSKNTSLYAEMENTSINDNILIKKIEIEQEDYTKIKYNAFSSVKDVGCGYIDCEDDDDDDYEDGDEDGDGGGYGYGHGYGCIDYENRNISNNKSLGAMCVPLEAVIDSEDDSVDDYDDEDDNDNIKYKNNSSLKEQPSKSYNYEKKEEIDKNKNKEINDFEKIILTQDIIEGNWVLNPQTQILIDTNKEIYEKIKNYIEKYNIKNEEEKISITILVLYCIKNNQNIEKLEYTVIINKGIEFLQSKGIEEIYYNNVEKYLNNK